MRADVAMAGTYFRINKLICERRTHLFHHRRETDVELSPVYLERREFGT